MQDRLQAPPLRIASRPVSQAPPSPDPGPEQAASDGPTASAPVPLDADDTRRKHLGDLGASPLTLSLGSVLVIACFVGGTIGGGVIIGLIAAAVGALLVFLVIYVMASSRAREDFFSSYAAARGLNRRSGKMPLPPTTPLLRKGDRRYGEQVMNGNLPDGAPGAIALYTYEEETRDSEGDSDTDYYRFTVVLHDIPTAAVKASDVYCQRRSGFRWMDSAEDVFRRMQRLELESAALDARYEVFFGAGDDEIWMKQLFSPTFIVWLTERTPKDFAFEFSAGSLCVNVKGHKDNAEDLDALCEAAGVVANRLASKSLD